MDICLHTVLHADVAIRAMSAGQDVLIELPLAASLDDAQRVASQGALRALTETLQVRDTAADPHRKPHGATPSNTNWPARSHFLLNEVTPGL